MVAFETLRPKLFAIAYRMLGSVTEAEDAVQETFLRTLDTRWIDVQIPEAFLRKTLIHYCLDQLKSARVQRESYVGTWLPEPLPTPDPVEQTEALSVGLMMLMENLSPPERAVFVLRETFDLSYAEIGSLLNKTESACRKLFSRARQRLNPEAFFVPPHAHPEDHRRTLTELLVAIQSGDAQALLSVLSPDVTSHADGGGKASAATHVLQGHETIAKLLLGLARKASPSEIFEIRSLHGQDNLVIRSPDGHIHTVMVIETHAGKVQHLFVVRNPDKLAHLQ